MTPSPEPRREIAKPSTAGASASGPATNWERLVKDAAALLEGCTFDRGDCDRLLAVLAAHGADSLIKGHRPVHLTSSLVVLDESLTQVLLTHHPKAGMWLQLGGHIEAGDVSMEAAALREGREEAGLTMPAHAVLVAVSPHELGGGFSCREHLDLQFAVAIPAEPPVSSSESLAVAWWPIASLPKPHGDDLPDLLARARSALA